MTVRMTLQAPSQVGASTALVISEIPFHNAIGAVRVEIFADLVPLGMPIP